MQTIEAIKNVCVSESNSLCAESPNDSEFNKTTANAAATPTNSICQVSILNLAFSTKSILQQFSFLDRSYRENQAGNADHLPKLLRQNLVFEHLEFQGNSHS